VISTCKVSKNIWNNKENQEKDLKVNKKVFFFGIPLIFRTSVVK